MISEGKFEAGTATELATVLGKLSRLDAEMLQDAIAAHRDKADAVLLVAAVAAMCRAAECICTRLDDISRRLSNVADAIDGGSSF